jgi:predicted transcriptional regulator/DNA-binding XRE family transcriptional regulator
LTTKATNRTKHKEDSRMQGSIVGTRIRQRRREIGVTQAELARRIGISASYLNLIEWNKRNIAGQLLHKIADALQLPRAELDGASEKRLLEALTEIAHLPSLDALGLEKDRTSELIGRFPGWAKGLAALVRSERQAVTRAQNLSDRLSNDPFLGETVHRMLTRIAAVRSAADILTEYPDLPTDRRERFDRIVHEESRALSDVGEALAVYLDKTEDADRVLTPLDEVEALFEARENRFAEIDEAAGKLTHLLTDPLPISRRAKAQALLDEHLSDLVKGVVHGQPQIKTAAARKRAMRALSDYAVSAIILPMETFEKRASEYRYDIEALADSFSVEVEVVCHRLTALPRNEDVPSFGYFQANAAGTIIEMLGLEGLALPRYAAACPLWVLYRAQQSPETFIRQRALFPSGARFVFVARARHTGPSGFGRPRHYVTDMIAMKENDSSHTVYSPDPSALVEEVGPSCRMCPRRSCLHRVEDPLSE